MHWRTVVAYPLLVAIVVVVEETVGVVVGSVVVVVVGCGFVVAEQLGTAEAGPGTQQP